MQFPHVRMRRLRRSETLRRMVRETRLSPDNLIQPLFVVPGKNVRKPVASMPGVAQLSVDQALVEAEKALAARVPAIILFGIPEQKDAHGSSSWSAEGIVQQAARAIKERLPELLVIADVCFCEYTDHGHCGVIERGDVENDATLANLAKQAVSLAQNGCDMIAPSGLMDGLVRTIRSALDEHRLSEVPIMSYSVKFASAYYGPFRDAAESAPQFGDRRTYQMDPGNAREALREAALDVSEGADILMVKPALAYLDLIRDLRERFEHPIAAYNGYIDRKRTILETLLSMRRAGADLILTYWATEVAGWLER